MGNEYLQTAAPWTVIKENPEEENHLEEEKLEEENHIEEEKEEIKFYKTSISVFF